MPTVRYQIRNEYGLADPELYRAADKDDPEAILEGVALAGLVGVLRQLGDLAEWVQFPSNKFSSFSFVCLDEIRVSKDQLWLCIRFFSLVRCSCFSLIFKYGWILSDSALNIKKFDELMSEKERKENVSLGEKGSWMWKVNLILEAKVQSFLASVERFPFCLDVSVNQSNWKI